MISDDYARCLRCVRKFENLNSYICDECGGDRSHVLSEAAVAELIEARAKAFDVLRKLRCFQPSLTVHPQKDGLEISVEISGERLKTTIPIPEFEKWTPDLIHFALVLQAVELGIPVEPDRVEMARLWFSHRPAPARRLAPG